MSKSVGFLPPVTRLKLASIIGSDFSGSISGWYLLCVKLQENNRSGGGGGHISSFYSIWFSVTSKKVRKQTDRVQSVWTCA